MSSLLLHYYYSYKCQCVWSSSNVKEPRSRAFSHLPAWPTVPVLFIPSWDSFSQQDLTNFFIFCHVLAMEDYWSRTWLHFQDNIFYLLDVRNTFNTDLFQRGINILVIDAIFWLLVAYVEPYVMVPDLNTIVNLESWQVHKRLMCPVQAQL